MHTAHDVIFLGKPAFQGSILNSVAESSDLNAHAQQGLSLATVGVLDKVSGLATVNKALKGLRSRFRSRLRFR